MRLESLATEQRLPRPLRSIFPFFEKPENLALITPPYLGFRILSPSPVEMKKHAVIDYAIRLHGIPMRWRTLIVDYEPPFRFVDKQLKGPYGFWEHEHTFRENNGETLLRDTVRYALPESIPSYFSGLIHENFVRPRLVDIFNYRKSVFSLMFGEESGP